MSKKIVTSEKATFTMSFSLLKKFIDVCPDEIWIENSGGWPVWQQVYHAIGSIDFFTAGSGQTPHKDLLSQEESHLKATSNKVISKAEMKNLAAEMETKAEKHFEFLNDDMLPQKDENLSNALKQDATYIMSLTMMTGHTLYHLGSCDAALRNHGLKGVF